ncbi:MAG TPA: hypothetical protein VMY37_40090 [Thermoguttaceae bacterium]|nr:hypothetical protein [Thermoguttaceae bacterium]
MLDRRSFLRLIGFAPAAALTKPNPQIIRLHGQRLPFTKSAEPRLASERSAVNCRHWSPNPSGHLMPSYSHVSFAWLDKPMVALSGLCFRGKDTEERRAEMDANIVSWRCANGLSAWDGEADKVLPGCKTCHAFETCDYFEEKP